MNILEINQDLVTWQIAKNDFVEAWEAHHGGILPVGACISITLLPPDPDNPARRMLSTCIHFSSDAPPSIEVSPRRKWWERLLAIPPRFPWPGDI